jgi:hypothetical protein
VGAAILLVALGLGAYQLFKPKPVHIASSGGGTSGGALLTPGTSSHQEQHADTTNTNPLLSSTGSSPDTSTSSTDTQAPVLPPAAPAKSAAPAKPAADSAVENAQSALNSGRLFRPRNNSAFYWARQAQQAGYPHAERLQQLILETARRQVERYSAAKNFPAAATLVSEMIEAYPKQVQPQAQPQLQRPQTAGILSFAVQHRHTGLNAFGRLNNSFCVGALSIFPNGNIRYDCVRSQDARCEHVTFSTSEVKQAKLINGGAGIHFATAHAGNWDFFGQPQQIANAFQTVSQLMAARQ